MKLVEFPIEGGGTVLVEVADTAGDGPVTRGLRPGQAAGRIAEESHHSFEGAVERVQPAAQVLIRRLRAMGDTPDEISIEFGMDLHAEAGAFIAAASAGANFKVTLMWRRSAVGAGST